MDNPSQMWPLWLVFFTFASCSVLIGSLDHMTKTEEEVFLLGGVGTGNMPPQRSLHGSDKVGHERDSFES